jgi:serine protease AprX
VTNRRDPSDHRPSWHAVPRIVATLSLAALLVAVLPGDVGQARLRGTLTKTVDRVTTTVEKTADTTVGGTLRTVDGAVGGTVTTLTRVVETAATSLTGWLYTDAETTLDHVADVTGASALWRLGYDGEGVGVALLDTGVVPVAGLTAGNVVNGPDLSFESQHPDARYLDTFGHGTHMAGIIAGRDEAGGRFRGIAPGATLVSLKLASYDGAVDVSQVIAAIDWVVQHRDEHNIRVLNLSYGTSGVQDYRLDPLTHAVQNAWRHGIVVVAAAGNSGFAPQLNNPAYDPYVLTVGAGDTHGTVTTTDDTVPEFSSRGSEERRPDLVAPGQSIVSLRNPGSYVDTLHAGARVDDRFFKGSGSSQAAAVVSGAVALLLQQRPDLTPDQVKHLLTGTAQPMPLGDEGAGAGMLHVATAAAVPAGQAVQRWERSTGLGSLDASRGTNRVADDGVELTGEQHLFGPWDARTWAPASAAGNAWAAGMWNGFAWTGEGWDEESWTGRSWSGRSWSGRSWSGRSWSGDDWSGRSWSGRSWSGDGWTGRSWSGRSWSGRSWSGAGSPP